MTEASVGICAHNEEETIGTLLDQIMEEDVPVEQVIVVVAGEDRTEEIVRSRSQNDSRIEMVREEERRGQSAAQNEILERVRNEALFLIDGDGLIKKGSLEALWREYDGESILYGREVPETPDNFTGKIIDTFWELHHSLSMRNPKYTTQLALQPSHLIDRIPVEIVIDDEYIGLEAAGKGYDIKYVPEAEKHHNIKGDIKSFARHRRKNWAGMFQIQEYGYSNLQSTRTKAKFFLRNFLASSTRRKFYLVILAIVELYAVAGALKDALTRDWPFLWKR